MARSNAIYLFCFHHIYSQVLQQRRNKNLSPFLISVSFCYITVLINFNVHEQIRLRFQSEYWYTIFKGVVFGNPIPSWKWNQLLQGIVSNQAQANPVCKNKYFGECGTSLQVFDKGLVPRQFPRLSLARWLQVVELQGQNRNDCEAENQTEFGHGVESAIATAFTTVDTRLGNQCLIVVFIFWIAVKCHGCTSYLTVSCLQRFHLSHHFSPALPFDIFLRV